MLFFYYLVKFCISITLDKHLVLDFNLKNKTKVVNTRLSNVLFTSLQHKIDKLKQ